jgi:hypothetical protein
MNNYVVLYRFGNPEVERAFAEKLNAEFPECRTEDVNQMHYYAFASRQQPMVEDQLKRIILHTQHTLGDQNIGDEDYVALYYARQEDTDIIKRSMLLGPDSLVEADENNIPAGNHVDTLTGLLEYNFLKNRPAGGN